MLKQDYHIHCELSPDSTAALDAVCSQAYRLGLEEAAFTDHYELIEGVTARGSIRREYLEISREKLLACLHRVAHRDLSLFNYREEDCEALGETYARELLEIARAGDYDCLSHLDLIRRYPAFQGVSLRMEDHMELVEEILKQVVRRGKGIEINTTAGSLAEPLPSLAILKAYRRLGGEIVTTGSDAHRAEDVAKGFDRAEELLREAGFSYAARYKERKPYFVKL